MADVAEPALRLLEDLDAAPDLHTVVLGAGANTALLIEAAPERWRSAVRAILDDDAVRVRRRIAGIPVRGPADYPLDQVERVVITSQMHETRLRRRALELFGPGPRVLCTFDTEASLASLLQRTGQALSDRWARPQADREALWLSADSLAEDLRAHLGATPAWRYGAARQIAELRALRARLDHSFSLEGCSMLNFGCGRYHPLGLSILAGALGARTMAIDEEPMIDPRRAARATAELCGRILLDPRVALGPDAPPRSEVLRRLESLLDLAALEGGSLPLALRGGPLGYIVRSLQDAGLPAASFDLIVSRDVFEHLSDVARALAILRELLRPGGRMVLFIDLSDHRRYQDGERYAHWSHLCEPQAPAFLGTNRLRFGQYPSLFAAAGLEILAWEAEEVEPLPRSARGLLAESYRAMADEDLAVSRAVALLRRPALGAHGIRA